MDTIQFAAERAARLKDADDEMRPFVVKALENFGQNSAWDDVVIGASVLWLETFEKHADPDAEPTELLAEFQRILRESLKQTAKPASPPKKEQVERITKWLGTITVNDATWRGIGTTSMRTMRWVTMRDDAVREMHVVADGQVRRIGGTFDVGGFRLHYPGEPVGPPEVWINCRCLIAPGSVRRSMNMPTETMAAVAEDVVEEVDTDLPEDPEEDADITGEALVDDPTDEVPWHAVLAPEGVATGDGRMFAEGALSTRTLPLPITYQYETAEGHMKAVVVARMDEAWKDEATGQWRARGVFWMNEPMAQKAIDGIAGGFLRGLSVDVDDVVVEQPNVPEDASIEDLVGMMNDEVTVFSKARIAGASIVHIPAFPEAYIALGPDFEDDVEVELTDEEVSALAACGCIEGVEDTDDFSFTYDEYREVSPEERERLAKEGKAMPDGSFPIANEEDLRNAIQAIGRAKDPEAAKRHIKKRAKDLGKEDLIPEGWAVESDGYLVHDLTELSVEQLAEYDALDADTDAQRRYLAENAPHAILAAAFAPGTKDGPGWITHPTATARIRRYWVRGKGALKIKWGAPGDFNRCRRQLAKYVQNPEWLAGLCANMHKEALGFWPAQHRVTRGHSLLASAAPAPMFNLVAAGGTVLPYEAFQNPGLDHPVGIVIDGDRIYGYVATWNVCHIGIANKCEMAPHSPSNYAYFRTGVVQTDQGQVPVGQITMDTGHASGSASARIAMAHYDNTGAAVADIAVGEDAIGIWFSGLLRPSATEEQRHALAATGRLSGDWRDAMGNAQLELVAALAVNVPGFPIPATALVASGGEVRSVVAMGIVDVEEATASASSELSADTIAAIARTAVEEYVHLSKKSVEREEALARLAEHRANLRAKVAADLRSKIKG